MKSSADSFKNNLDKAFSTITLNTSTMGDHMKYKQGFKEEKLDGGRADKMSLGDIATKFKVDITKLTKQFIQGVKVEMEHSDNKQIAKEIAMDHLSEDPKYYEKLKKIENKEATGSGSSGAYSGPVFGGDDEFWKRSKSETPSLKESDVEKIEATEATGSGSSGGYETPAMWAKSTSKKDWGPSRKTQYKGGSFVKIKKKCTRFPYCNQGDISNLKLSKNESVKEAIKNVASRLKLSENVIITILEHEYQNKNKRQK